MHPLSTPDTASLEAAGAPISETKNDEVLVLDFGGQYSQLIARRVRECGVFSELLPHDVPVEEVGRRAPRGLILSGGPEDPARSLAGIQFHPEVVHTPYGTEVLRRFLDDICGCSMDWSAASVIDEQVARIREQVGDGKIICGLSGGVDSSVAALLVH